MKQAVREVLAERDAERGDPDAGLELGPEIIAPIQQQRQEIAAGKPGTTLEQLMHAYGIE